MPEPPLLEGSGLRLSIGRVRIADGLELAIQPGECWCMLGRNGCGKTTLMHTLAGLRPPDLGHIRIAGRPIEDWTRRQLATRIGILFQDYDDPFPATVMETVLQGRHPWLRPWQWESGEDREIAREALAFVGLEDLAGRNVQTLSGGERQRVGIAALRAQQPRLLLLDEPTSHLDLHHRIDILQRLVASCRDRGQALCMILHDINLAARLADHLLLIMGDGETCSGPRDTLLDTERLERLYNHRLVQLDTPSGPAWLPA